DLSWRQWIARTRLNDFDDNAFLDNHPVESRAFVSDHTDVCRGVGLKYGDAALLVFLPQRRKKRASGYDRFLKRLDLSPCLSGLVEQDLEIIRHSDVGRRLESGDGLDLLLGIARAGCNHGTAQCPSPSVHDPGAWRQMIGERIVDDVT